MLRRHFFLLLLVVGSFAFLMLQAPIPQDLAYHQFIDKRSFFGIANFFNVISNLPFLLVGLTGIIFCSRGIAGSSKTAWLVFFIGISLVALGSGYYHLNPDNERLLWDRLPMTMGFMGMFAALLGESIDPRLTRYLLFPLVLIGLASALVWHWHDDLRLYVWVQFMPLLVIPVLLLTYRKRYSHSGLIVLALVCYVIAKWLEAADIPISRFFHDGMGGHAIKHVFAAIGGACILWMLRIRQAIG